jgi:predicted DNA-binding protein
MIFYSVLQKGVKMTRGRNTSTITIRMADEAVESLKYGAVKKGMGYTVLAREYILSGLREFHKDIIVSNMRGETRKIKTKEKRKKSGKRKRRH